MSLLLQRSGERKNSRYLDEPHKRKSWLKKSGEGTVGATFFKLDYKKTFMKSQNERLVVARKVVKSQTLADWVPRTSGREHWNNRLWWKSRAGGQDTWKSYCEIHFARDCTWPGWDVWILKMSYGSVVRQVQAQEVCKDSVFFNTERQAGRKDSSLQKIFWILLEL